MVKVKRNKPIGHIAVIVTEEPEDEHTGQGVTLSCDDRDGCKIGITYNRNVEMPTVEELLALWATHYARIHGAAFTELSFTPLPNLGASDMLFALHIEDD